VLLTLRVQDIEAASLNMTLAPLRDKGMPSKRHDLDFEDLKMFLHRLVDEHVFKRLKVATPRAHALAVVQQLTLAVSCCAGVRSSSLTSTTKSPSPRCACPHFAWMGPHSESQQLLHTMRCSVHRAVVAAAVRRGLAL